MLFFIISCDKENESEVTITEECLNISLELVNETNWEIAMEISKLINQYRHSKNLPPIGIDMEFASAYAVEHVKYMISVGNINHDNFIHRSNCLIQRGVIQVSEIVASGYLTPEGVVTAWINSPEHNRVFLYNFNYCGYGIVKNDDGSYYYSLLFYLK
jgi:uncharacterized protein YkwD